MQTNNLNYPKDRGMDIIAILANDVPSRLEGAISLYQKIESKGGNPIMLYINPENEMLRRLSEKYRIVGVSVQEFSKEGKEVKVSSITAVTGGSYRLDPLSVVKILLQYPNAKLWSFSIGEKDEYGNSIHQLVFTHPVSFSDWNEVSKAVESILYRVETPVKTGRLERLKTFLRRLYK